MTGRVAANRDLPSAHSRIERQKTIVIDIVISVVRRAHAV